MFAPQGHFILDLDNKFSGIQLYVSAWFGSLEPRTLVNSQKLEFRMKQPWFAPIVSLIRRVLGVERFTHIRAEIIVIHSSIIIHASGWMGLNHVQEVALLHTARENGRKLGFLI